MILLVCVSYCQMQMLKVPALVRLRYCEVNFTSYSACSNHLGFLLTKSIGIIL